MESTKDVQTLFATDQQIRQAASVANKHALFKALHEARITLVTVTFDGEGDSGQINDITAWASTLECPIPEISVRLHSAEPGRKVLTTSTQSLRDAIETMCYDFLEHEQGGWENDDGAYGEFRFDVAALSIELEFSSRFTDVYTSNHSF